MIKGKVMKKRLIIVKQKEFMVGYEDESNRFKDLFS